MNQAQTLIAIESMIDGIHYKQRDNGHIRDQLQVLIPAFKIQHIENVWYSQHIQIFIHLMNNVDYYLKGHSYDNIDTFLDQEVDFLRSLVDVNYSHVHVERNAFQMQETRNRQSLREYMTRVMHQKSRSLVVRVDLKYLTHCHEQIDIISFSQHMATLRNRISNGDRCFADLEGFVWAMEQGGRSGGFHCHLMLIYDGHKHQNDYGLAIAVGHLWREITNDMGCFYTSNDPETKQRFADQDKLMLGRIERSDAKLLQNVIDYDYFAQPDKVDQRMRVKLQCRSRTFGTGQ